MSLKNKLLTAVAGVLLMAGIGTASAQEKITIMPGSWSGNTIDFLKKQIRRGKKKAGTFVSLQSDFFSCTIEGKR